MNFKKIAAVALAAMTVLGATSVFAADEKTVVADDLAGGTDVTIDTEQVEIPTINITVPTTAKIGLNPYKLAYTGTDTELAALADTAKAAQIVSAVQTVKNGSNVAVTMDIVDAQVESVSEGVGIASASVAAKGTAKEAFLYLEVISNQSTDFTAFADTYSKAKNQIILPLYDSTNSKFKAAELVDQFTLGAATYSDGTMTAGTETTAEFKIGGDLVANPVITNTDKSTTPNPWTADDAITVSFKFMFEPQVVTSGS